MQMSHADRQFRARWAARVARFVVRSTTHMSKSTVTLLMVFGVQSAMAWGLYRSRAVLHASWTHSDFVVFGLPLAVGFALSACVLFFSFPQMPVRKRLTAIFGLSAVGATISSFVGTVIAF